VKELAKTSILISKRTSRLRRLVSFSIEGFLFLVTSISTIAVVFIILYIARDALPFFELRGIKEFFTSISWYPSGSPPEFGALAIIFGSMMVTFLAVVIAVPLAIFSAVSLSDILPFLLSPADYQTHHRDYCSDSVGGLWLFCPGGFGTAAAKKRWSFTGNHGVDAGDTDFFSPYLYFK
jgi:hypothetical protein